MAANIPGAYKKQRSCWEVTSLALRWLMGQQQVHIYADTYHENLGAIRKGDDRDRWSERADRMIFDTD